MIGYRRNLDKYANWDLIITAMLIITFYEFIFYQYSLNLAGITVKLLRKVVDVHDKIAISDALYKMEQKDFKTSLTL